MKLGCLVGVRPSRALNARMRTQTGSIKGLLQMVRYGHSCAKDRLERDETRAQEPRGRLVPVSRPEAVGEEGGELNGLAAALGAGSLAA